ncbi:myb/SANT-like DNA-binding domain-containing protein 4 [Chiloscyllium plagiosum]|uniref:myb/SANT-like DNA-binding domain-containing protein 4 n=1 Tax=Chiloscyllium plagiosum TaxID=36176 RepID=UPI001CB87DCB|nr:myb/SANT-like DNA-binding domain-containing protein 4 [Chiloscyllium plagiosum]XP_043547759.1 myb/SANT-like DNA-binding domain-containing protein 4 [Chiloscyllium plagiosum]XP_043547760.1 myb/SANT-like DNA-binding domain-containing protein 4 [Chiloscyllium plagiosum]
MKQFKRKRKSNFTMKETETLLKEVEDRRDIIYTQQHDAITNELKWMAWKEIAEKVSAASGGEQRTAYEVKKKYTDLKCYLKKRGECLDRMEAMMTDCSPTSIHGFNHSAINGETSCKFDDSFLIDEPSRPLCVVKVEDGDDHVEEEEEELGLQHTEFRNLAEEPNAFTSPFSTVRPREVVDNYSEAEGCSSSSDQPAVKNCSSRALFFVEKQRLELEKQRVALESERLQVEKERLLIEKEKLRYLDIENERLQLEKERLQLERERLHIKREKLKLLTLQVRKLSPEKELDLLTEKTNLTSVDIEAEKLKLEKERLHLKKERLQFLNIESEKLQIEKERLQLERERLQLQKDCQKQ